MKDVAINGNQFIFVLKVEVKVSSPVDIFKELTQITKNYFFFVFFIFLCIFLNVFNIIIM